MSGRIDLPQGTLDLLILKTLSLAAMHGWAISERIRQVSRDALHVNQGSLYPALYRLEHQGLLDTEWGTSENNRRAKYYSLTAAGRKRMREETDSWNRLAVAMSTALKARPSEG